ncbi:hypothetical protein ROZALSC1DRAFT_25394, partial [Rozella allomycis CSF55]
MTSNSFSFSTSCIEKESLCTNFKISYVYYNKIDHRITLGSKNGHVAIIMNDRLHYVLLYQNEIIFLAENIDKLVSVSRNGGIAIWSLYDYSCEKNIETNLNDITDVCMIGEWIIIAQNYVNRKKIMNSNCRSVCGFDDNLGIVMDDVTMIVEFKGFNENEFVVKWQENMPEAKKIIEYNREFMIVTNDAIKTVGKENSTTVKSLDSKNTPTSMGIYFGTSLVSWNSLMDLPENLKAEDYCVLYNPLKIYEYDECIKLVLEDKTFSLNKRPWQFKAIKASNEEIILNNDDCRMSCTVTAYLQTSSTNGKIEFMGTEDGTLFCIDGTVKTRLLDHQNEITDIVPIQIKREDESFQ